MNIDIADVAQPVRLARASDRSLARALRRFAPTHRDRVAATADRHPWIADLAASFPALLFALAVPRRGFDPEPILTAAAAGTGLKQLAADAGVPLWLRALSPECFVRALPGLPDGECFRHEIRNFIPRSQKRLPHWLDIVAAAHVWGPEGFAIWAAREAGRDLPYMIKLPASLCLWAWYCGQPQSLAGRMLHSRWNSGLSCASAVLYSFRWEKRIDLLLELERKAIADCWLMPGKVGPYDFVPLRTAVEIAMEAHEMRHCVDAYGARLSGDSCRLWSMQEDGKRVATLQLGVQGGDPFLRIVQLRGYENKRCPDVQWWAAREWLNRHDITQLRYRSRSWAGSELNPECWRAVWRPYWLAKRRIPDWLPLSPSRAALQALSRDLSTSSTRQRSRR